MSKDLARKEPGKTFEELKQINEHGAEFWNARDLQPLLGYTQWRRFENAIKKAVTSCETSGNDPAHHFAGAGKMVELGSESVSHDQKRENQDMARVLSGESKRFNTAHL